MPSAPQLLALANTMNEIEELKDLCIKATFSLIDWSECMEWAVHRLVKDSNEKNEDIILLASSSSDEEIRELVHKILYSHLDHHQINLEFLAGKYVVKLHELYYRKEIDIFNLEKRLWKLYYKLAMPNWLTMLARNCEYSTDISAYEEPFAKEFEYIVRLWRGAESLKEFNSNYSREISNSHDAK